MQTRGTTGTARMLPILGFLCAAIAVVYFPIVFGPAAIVLGVVAQRRGDPLGSYAAVAGVVGLVAGVTLAAIVLGTSS